MTPETYLVLKHAANTLSMLFGVGVAVLGYWDLVYRNRSDTLREWFRCKVGIINKSKTIELPRRAINFISICANNFFAGDYIIGAMGNFRVLMVLSFFYAFICLIMFFVIKFPYLFDIYEIADYEYTYIFTIVMFLFFVYLCFMTSINLMIESIREAARAKSQNIFPAPMLYYLRSIGGVAGIIIVPMGFLAILSSLYISLHENIVLAAVLCAIFLPIYLWVVLMMPDLIVDNLRKLINFSPVHVLFLEEKLTQFALGAGTSFAVTFVSLAIGHISVSFQWVPQTFQMLMANVLFDGLTLVVTFSILKWAIKRRENIRIPIAIVFDVLFSAIFACGALYFGLLGTPNYLSLEQTVYVLLAREPSGENWTLGPYFWVMHTTFIPTIFYITIIFALWIIKCIVQPVVFLFGAAAVHKHPLLVVSAACAVFVSLFQVLAGAAGGAYELAKASG